MEEEDRSRGILAAIRENPRERTPFSFSERYSQLPEAASLS